ncbi:MAG TPA: hypothetical protein VFG05_04495 [Methylocella sp.]|nr:hypothetical protein [Methylocella sp.]
MAKLAQSDKPMRVWLRALLLLPAAILLLTDCEPDTNTALPKPRPVRTAAAEKSELGSSVVLTGKLNAILKSDPGFASRSTYAGRGAIRSYLTLNVLLANDFFTQAVVFAKVVPSR